MLKDFPSFLFTSEKVKPKDLELETTKNAYDQVEDVAKLKYTYPVDISYTHLDSEPKCLTQMYLASDFLKKRTPILPWTPGQAVDTEGYNLYLDFKNTCEQIKQDTEFYYADCLSTLGRFYPNLFAGGSVGKCVYTEGHWLTPIEFQKFSGSQRADWKMAIQLRRPDESKRKVKYKSQRVTIKSLIDDGTLELHPVTCSCNKCQGNYNMQTENIDLLSTFFMNSGQELIVVHPNLSDQSILDLNIYKCEMNEVQSIPDILLPHNRSNLSKNKSKHHVQTIGAEGINAKIKQIHCQTFDEYSTYFDSQKIAEDVTEAFLTVNFSDTKAQTYLLELNEDGYFNARLLYDMAIGDGDLISDITQSHLIQGETAYVLKKSGDVFLVNEESNSKVATGLQPIWCNTIDLNYSWRSIKFGSQPRQFIYSDHSQIISIDSRIKTLDSNLNRAIYTAERSDPIQRTQLCQNEYYTHLVCTSNELILIDERFNVNNRPLLSWTHHLKSPATYLSSLYLASPDKDYTHLAICTDSMDTFAYQFSLKTGTFLSHNFPRKLDSPRNLIEYLPEDYDKRLNRHLDYRLEKPIVGMSTLKYKNSFSLFQIQPNLDIFHECFEVTDTEEKNTELIEKPKIMKNWLNSVKKEVMSDSELDGLEMELNGMEIQNKDTDTKSGPDFILEYLPEALKNCRVCHEDDFVSGPIEKSNEVCPRCGLSISDSSQLMNADPMLRVISKDNDNFVGSLIDLENTDLENELTKELYSVWVTQDSKEQLAEELERNKRLKVSE